MARRMAIAGHDVHMVTSRRSGGETGWRQELVEGVTVHWLSLDYDNAMSNAKRIRSFLVFSIAAGFQARRLRGDVVFASSTPLTIAIPGIFATRFRKAELVFEVRDLWPSVPIAMGALRNPLAKWLAYGLERLAYRESAVVVALSEDMTAEVERTGSAKRVVTVPNSSDVELFGVPESQGRTFRNARPWLGERPLVVYCGTLGRVNGVRYMVDLAERVAARLPDARFLIVGDGIEAGAVRAYAEERGLLGTTVFFEKPVPKEEVPAIMSAADVCTSWVIPVPELESNSANKFFDSLAAARPIVINHGGWQSRVIQRESIGLVLSATDLEGAATDLVELLTDDARLLQCGQNAARLARDVYSRDQLAQELIGVLEDADPRRRLGRRAREGAS
jgi:glycosyltransferase involved in cell wall biosynthesis